MTIAWAIPGGVTLPSCRHERPWSRETIRCTPSGLVHAIVVSVTARGRGEVALSYYATPDKGDAFGARGMNWRAWMTYSPDALSTAPEFRSAPTSPESAPTMGADMSGCCTTEQTFLEYTGVKFVSPTEIRGAFTRWTGKHLPELVLAKLRLPARPKACRSRRWTLPWQRGRAVGPRRSVWHRRCPVISASTAR